MLMDSMKDKTEIKSSYFASLCILGCNHDLNVVT